ncbi:anthocyanin-related membrane protein [Anaeramoeba ignava]|uniref:Anthocyanin-related membrane protein n=1 Tax=Anaeramoeba ignava TaxID=1746090 RepID=A0A9Q0R8R3_ANAIG|nr:anthocyanin-related membrane protein [Anaeramoeba ignava]
MNFSTEDEIENNFENGKELNSNEEKEHLLFNQKSFSQKFSKIKIYALILGQILSISQTATGIFNQFLDTKFNIVLPIIENLFNYLLLGLIYSIPVFILEIRKPTNLKKRIWIYFIAGIVDSSANFFAVKTFEYITISRTTIYSSFNIPCIMIISRIFLKYHYFINQILGAFMCFSGLIILGILDSYHHSSEEKNPIIGTIYCLISAFLYAISNVLQEYIVKKHGSLEFLGMIGISGSIFCSILFLNEVHQFQNNYKFILGIFGFSLCMFILYSLVPVMLKISNATLFGLSLSTSNFYSLFAELFLFQNSLPKLYFVVFVIVVLGIIIFTIPKQFYKRILLSITHLYNNIGHRLIIFPQTCFTKKISI